MRLSREVIVIMILFSFYVGTLGLFLILIIITGSRQVGSANCLYQTKLCYNKSL